MRILFAFLFFFFPPSLFAENACELAKKDPSSSIGQLSTKETFCTGVLLSPHVVLTAAHCVKTEIAENLKFTLKGDTTLGDVRDHASVAEMVIHPTYWKSADGSAGGVDLALVRLKDKNYGTAPVLYLSVLESTQFKDGEHFVSWGYGVNEVGANGVKRKKDVVFKGYDSTIGANGSRMEKVRLEFSRGDTGEIQCFGDSGGPVLLEREGRWWITGINSRGGYAIRYSSKEGLRRRLAAKEFLCEQSTTFKSVSVGLFSVWIRENLNRLETEKLPVTCGY